MTAHLAMETLLPGVYEGRRAVLGYFVDITERKEVEHVLQESERRFRELANSLPEIIFETDAQGSITFANRNASTSLGYADDELVKGMYVFQILVPGCREKAMARFQRVLAGETLSATEYTALRKDGSTFPLLANASPVVRNNQIVGIQGIAIDISDRKRAEEEYRKIQERFSGIFSSSKDAIGYASLDGRILDVNESFCRLTGYSRGELLGGMKYYDLSPLEYQKREARIINKILRTGEPAEYEKEYIRKDGSRVSISLTTFSVKGNNGEPMALAAIIKDISEQKSTRELMRFYIAEITRAQEEERSRIARDLHDETAQSLSTVLLDIETIKRSADSFPRATLCLLNSLRARVHDTLQQVRRFARELRPQVLDQMGLVPALELVTADLQASGINAYIHVTGSERRLPPGMELGLFRIAQEALRNVRKHSRATEATVTLEYGKDKVKLHIVDNGCGFKIPERMVEFAGTGKLGLIGIQERVRLVGGEFSIDSQPGQGTVLTVEVEG